MKKLIWSTAMIGAILLGGCNETKKNVVLTKEIKFTKEGTLSIKKAITDSIAAQLSIEFAQTDYETQTGLMYRKGMENSQGMLFIFKNERIKSFYMKNTEFSLDIIYLNSKLEIVSITKNTEPLNQTSIPSEAPAQYVLEVNGGLSNQWGLEKGDVVEYSKL